MESIKEFPRGINSDQVISRASATAQVQRAPGPGLVCALGRKATSHKLQSFKPQATSFKPQAASIKLQAASYKLPDSRSFIKFQAASIKGLDYNKTIDWVPYMEGNLVW